jgi:hypothetical protein
MLLTATAGGVGQPADSGVGVGATPFEILLNPSASAVNRICAASMLSNAELERAQTKLIALLPGYREWGVTDIDNIYVLGEIGSESAIAALEKVQRTPGKPPRAQSEVRWSIAKIHFRAAAVQAASDPNIWINDRVNAAEELNPVGRGRAQIQLLAEFPGNWGVEATDTAFVLSKIGDDDAADRLTAVVNSPHTTSGQFDMAVRNAIEVIHARTKPARPTAPPP